MNVNKDENLKNPYKALASYEESDKNEFHGRKVETEKIYQLVRLNPLTVVIGKSGIGKTSLLNAGVFPKLRTEGYLPIRLRLNYTQGKNIPELLEQIRQGITGELKEKKIEVKTRDKDKPVKTFAKGETLWEYFRRVQHFVPSKKPIVTPVLIFDQFEEFFTLGKEHRDREKLIDELYWLVEDQFPESLKERIKREANLAEGQPTFRVVLSIREDYLPHLIELKPRIPSIDRVMYRVTHLNGLQAREIIGMPEGFQDENVVNDILRNFYPEEMWYDNKRKISDKELEIEPAFLSLLCYQFYEKQPTEPINVRFRDKILEEFYDFRMAKFPEKIKIFIESKLLTDGGFRTPFYLEKGYKYQDSIDRLVDLRILRKYKDGQKEYVEISHDVLAPIIKEKREKRLAEEKRKKVLEKSMKWFIYFAVIILAITTMISIYQTNRAGKQYKNAQVNWLTAEALLEFPIDNTKAIRIAAESFKKGLPHPPARTCRVLSDIAYSSYQKPFYSATIDHDHKDSIYSVVFSPDGQNILTASEDKTAKLWDIDGNLLSEKIKHDARVMSAVFSPDGKYILTASWDKTAKLWSFGGKLQAEFKHEGPVSSAVFSPDGNLILTASRDNTARLWGLEGELRATFSHDAAVSAAVFLLDGGLILTASWDKSGRLWDMEGNLLQEFPHDGAVESAVFSPDGRYILTASWDKSAKLWDFDGKILEEFKHDKAVTSALFSKDGSRILTVSHDGTARLWAIGSEKFLAEFKHDGEVTSAYFSPDGHMIATASKDGTAKLWHLDGTLLASMQKHEGEVSAVDFSPDGSKVLTASNDGTAKLWQLKSTLLVNLQHKDEVTSVSFSPDGNRILTTSRDKTAKLWDIEGSLLTDLNKHKGIVYSAEFSPDDSRILTASDDGTAKLWDSQGKFLFNLRHYGPVTSAVFSPDGSQILTASLDQSAKLWGIQGNLIKTISTPNSALSSAVFSPKGNLILTVSLDDVVKVWDREGKELVELPHDRSVSSAVFSPNGNLILTASTGRIARLWSLEGKLLKEDFKHNREISSALFSPDGKWILTASYDGTAKIWDLKGKPIVELKHDGPVLSAKFSRDGRFIITASEDGTAKLWDIAGNLLANLDKHNNVVSSAVFSPDGSRIITISKDDTAKIWLTPNAIYEWLKTAKIAPLSEKDKKIGIN